MIFVENKRLFKVIYGEGGGVGFLKCYFNGDIN